MAIEWREDAPGNLIKLAVGRCMIDTMNAGKWLELGLLTNTQDEIQGHSRLLRSLQFGDDDYEGCVLEMVPNVLGENPYTLSQLPMPNLVTVTEFLELPVWLAEHDGALFARLFVATNDATLPDGTVLSVAEATAARLEVGEMRRQIERIRRDHADDPEALVGQAKELIETTCKTILGITGDGDDGALDVPALVKQTLLHLGLDPTQVGEAGGDLAAARALKRLLGGVSTVLNGAAELHNKRGTGHGRSGGPLVDGPVARLTVGLVLPAVVYLCEVYENRTEPEPEVSESGLLDNFLESPSADLAIGDIVRHATFGEGQVVELRQSEQGAIATVDFGGETGRKRLLTRYAGLEVVRSLTDSD